MNARISKVRLLVVCCSLAILSAVAIPAIAAPILPFSFGPVDIEITDESFNLEGGGPIPLDDGYSPVESKISVKEHPTTTSVMQSTVTLDLADFVTPINAIPTTPFINMTLDFSLTLFPLIEISDNDPAGDPSMAPGYGGGLVSPLIIDPVDPLVVSSSHEISLDLSTVDGTLTIFELLTNGFDFSTLPIAVNELSSSSSPLTFSMNLGTDVGGTAAEDYIELTIDGLVMGDGGFNINELLMADILDASFEFEFPSLMISGKVADIGADPPFGPFELIAVAPEFSVPEPEVILLMAVGLVGIAGLKRVGHFGTHLST